MRLDQMMPGSLKVPVSDADHARGRADASVTLVEYGDYECPFCGKAYPVVEQIREDFGDQLRFVFRNFPLSKQHPHARAAACAAEAAALQGEDKFWGMHDLLYENQDRLAPDDLLAYATQLALDLDRFAADVESAAVTDRIDSDFTNGVRSGVNGTPTFFINTRRMNLPPDYESLKMGITKALASRDQQI